MKSILGMFHRILSIIMFIIAVGVIGLYIITYYFSSGKKGISHTDLSQICIVFLILYIVKFILQWISRETK
jgi:hypothetical protein